MEYNVGYYFKHKKEIVSILTVLNFHKEAQKMNDYLTGTEVPIDSANALEEAIWNNSFKERLQPKIIEWIESNKKELINLQKDKL